MWWCFWFQTWRSSFGQGEVGEQGPSGDGGQRGEKVRAGTELLEHSIFNCTLLYNSTILSYLRNWTLGHNLDNLDNRHSIVFFS